MTPGPAAGGDLGLLADILIAFNLGLFAQVHCIAMCGGVIGALTLAIPAPLRAQRGVVGFALAYNTGRIVSYMLAGALLAVLGAGVVELVAAGNAHRVLRIAAALVLFVAGLTLLGVRAPGALLERGGARWWRLIQRQGRKLLPVNTLPRAWGFGALWGFLPCALVYATVLFAATGGSASRGALIMLAFGFGTSPALIAAACFAPHVSAILGQPWLRRLAGLVLIAAALAYPFIDTLMGAGHTHH